MIRAVLLDALGTMIGFDPPAPALRAALAEHGVDVPLADAERAVKAEIGYYRAHLHRARDAEALRTLRAACAAVIRAELPAAAALPEPDLVEAVLASFRFHAFADVPPELAELRAAGVTLVGCSNWDVSLHDVLRATGLAPLLAGTVTSAELGVSKPDPAPFRAALAVAGDVPPGEALHVGDSLPEDVAGARSAGLAVVLIDRAGEAGDAPPGALDGVVVLPSLNGLAALVARANA